MRKSRLLALVLVLALAVSSLAACGKKEAATNNTETNTSTSDNQGSTNDGGASEDVDYTALPFTTEPVTLTMFIGMDANLATAGKSYEDIDFFQEMEKRTGIHLDFQIPASGENTTAFNLMIASGELTDLITYAQNYPDGLDAAVEDGYYLDLTPYQDTYMQDYKALRTKNDFYAKSTITDGGRIAAAYQIYSTPQGPWWSASS